MIEKHKCLGCATDKPVEFEIVSVRKIHYGNVYYRVCPKGHQVWEHRK